ncbi:Oidioi.mRNA.OKI2018_I69.XSR.g14225.t1.cds [Oikopleura dioica]|uniref:Oidioi.mRNA.OKI2018_I69.XSR.g14225.t1.cds n=1 Tax=Oikopleura dioica TaxID=34765 RepID=A0ABN7S960_OIKDI|nr:Oidioi.mRNA.OKI2018_I69.XSR.g14225.t1.cds [Oikopleura dioica]
MLKNLPSMPDSHPVKTQVEEEIKFEQEIKEENIKSEPMDASQDDGPLLKPVDLGATNPTLNILNPIAGAQFVPKQVRPNRTAKHPLSKNIQDQTKHLVPERINKKRKSYDQPVRDSLPNMNPYKHKMREPKQFSNGAPATSNPPLPKTNDTVKTEPAEQQPSTKQQKVEEPVNEDDWDDLPSELMTMESVSNRDWRRK